MSILEKLSSRVGDRTEESNKAVAAECLKKPLLLKEIESGLLSLDAKLVADCAEVMTNIAIKNPELIIPFAGALLNTITHKNSKAKWEAVHSLSLIAEYIPDDISNSLTVISDLMINDKSIIVRDYSTDIIANYAKVGKSEAQKAYPLLKEIIYKYDGKHAGHALKGLKNVIMILPEYKNVVAGIAVEFITHKKAVVSKTARSLVKTVQSVS